MDTAPRQADQQKRADAKALGLDIMRLCQGKTKSVVLTGLAQALLDVIGESTTTDAQRFEQLTAVVTYVTDHFPRNPGEGEAPHGHTN